MKQQTIRVTGSLDLVTDKLSVDHGTSKYCLNYEVANVLGIRRIDGFSRWDGRALTDGYVFSFYVDTGATSPTLTVGEIATVTYLDSVTLQLASVSATVFSVENTVVDLGDGVYRHYGRAVIYDAINITDAGDITNVDVAIGDGEVVSSAFGGAAYEAYSALVTAVPGIDGSIPTKIPGLHFFNDKLYAVVDLVAIEVELVSSANQLLDGAKLSKTSGGSSFGTIALTRPSSTAGRTVIELFDFVGGTSLSNNDAIFIGSTQVAKFKTYAAPQRAALYSATWDSAGGWTRVDMGRKVQYVEGASSDATAFFLPYRPAGYIDQLDENEVKDTGWIGADSYETIGAGVGGDWSGTGGAELQSQDGTNNADAGFSGAGLLKTLKAKFSADVLQVPAGCTVRGVEVRVSRWAGQDNPPDATAANRFFDHVVKIGKTGGLVSSTNKADTTTPVPISTGVSPFSTTKTYGASNDAWALPLNPVDVNDGGFNVQVQYRQASGTYSMYVDQVAVKVYYTEQNRKAYVYDSTKSPTDQEIEVIHFTVVEGTETGGTNGDRRGVLVLNPGKTVANSAKPWLWRPGLQIRTQTGGLGAILAEVAAQDEPITLPSSHTIAENNARYVFDDARPYARDDLDVFFCCNGAENAYMFDGKYMMPIQTGLIESLEKPRHVAWSGNYLALGYATGSIAISDLGDPLTYISTSSLAAEIGASDRVTGLLNLKGDSLGVFTERTIFALQGSDAESLRRISISPSSGAIEYTVKDMGMPMFCDYRGIGTIQTTDQYGDFSRGRLSWRVTPWLLDRLQSSRRNETVDKTPVVAYACRNKNQYRVLFSDGWQATLTIGEENQAYITTQRFYGDYTDRDGTAIKVLGITDGVTSTGQDMMFMSFDVDPESSRYRYAFQIDAGRSFDGEEIIAQWMGQPISFGQPFMTKTIYQVGLHGKAYGTAALAIYCGTDYTDPVGEEVAPSSANRGYAITLGTAAAATEGDYKAIKSIRASGEDFTFLIESLTSSELPHTIQAIVVRWETEEAMKR